MIPEFLIGAWILTTALVTDAEGRQSLPFGEQPNGRFMLDERGYFSAHVCRGDRHRYANGEPSRAEKIQSYDDCVSYFGQVTEYDPDSGRFVSTVVGASNANWIGGQQVRYLERLEEAHIRLTTAPLSFQGQTLTGQLTWRKLN